MEYQFAAAKYSCRKVYLDDLRSSYDDQRVSFLLGKLVQSNLPTAMCDNI